VRLLRERRLRNHREGAVFPDRPASQRGRLFAGLLGEGHHRARAASRAPLSPSGSGQNRLPRPRAGLPGVVVGEAAADLNGLDQGHPEDPSTNPGIMPATLRVPLRGRALPTSESASPLSTYGAAEAWTTAWFITPAGRIFPQEPSRGQLLPRLFNSIPRSGLGGRKAHSFASATSLLVVRRLGEGWMSIRGEGQFLSGRSGPSRASLLAQFRLAERRRCACSRHRARRYRPGPRGPWRGMRQGADLAAATPDGAPCPGERPADARCGLSLVTVCFVLALERTPRDLHLQRQSGCRTGGLVLDLQGVELMAEPAPDRQCRNSLLIYENPCSEQALQPGLCIGGAGNRSAA